MQDYFAPALQPRPGTAQSVEPAGVLQLEQMQARVDEHTRVAVDHGLL